MIMMRYASRLAVLLSAVCTGAMLYAQLPTVDITWSVLPTQQVEVRMRPDGPFNSLFSSEVFTIRWLDTGTPGLGSISQDPEYFACVPVSKSGPEQVDGIYRYQVFYGSSLITFADAELAWEADQEYVIARIAILNGAGFFEIVNDEWTGELTNNGNYYVSLEGQDRTGEIYNLSTEVEASSLADHRMHVAPNPATDVTILELDLPAAWPGTTIRLMDASGRTLWSHMRDIPAGSSREVIDVSGAAPGAYVLQVVHGEGSISRQLIIGDRSF
jgi:hypothetical protein